ncbi:hypothetical protein Psta_3633 [Pirellula staleyi DSM 6068]|uniref:Uncharacterized protein n=1 Tax=Pirellula staleyi (strain ATCC 27377 / DSM 6068 / ICPB 4128) TaxID=530564 RepID=D2QZA2_PIRSD|nr:hypothetical protein [Pirellula staleyi]ADB18294.1 hypothetical protein Psta_3633 [Pirellula staleyi DSM 6068]
MKLDKLSKQLRRDLAANPKRAIVLGLMVVVALYFWAPLVWGWMKPTSSGGKSAVAKSTSEPLVEATADASVTKSKKKSIRWELLAVQMAGDPRMKPLRASVIRDPFQWKEPPPSNVSSEATDELAQASVKPLAPSVKPTAESLGLKLESVLVSSRGNVAMINGRVAREGQSINISASDASQFEAVVMHVDRDRVELRLAEETITLTLAAPKLASGDELRAPVKRGE